MSFSHRAEQRGDRLLDVLTEEESGLRLIVSRLGAEIISLARRNPAGDWVGFLYRDNDITVPGQGWANHATVMGYYLHRLKDGRSWYRGHEIRGGTHSFLRSRNWHLAKPAQLEDASLTYGITPQDFSTTDYPLNVSVDLTYRIVKDGIVVAFRFKNDEPTLTAHVEFGLHPGFGSNSFETFQFRMPPGKYRRHFSPQNYLSGDVEDIDFAGGEMPFPRAQLPGSCILELVDVPVRRFVFSDPPSQREVILDLAGVPYLTLWSDGGPFLCVEPCWGLTDHHQQRPFEEKEGVQTIPAQKELVAQFVMMPQFTSAD